MGYNKIIYEIVKDAEDLVNAKLKFLGINKKNEIVRLLTEISKKEKISPEDILDDIDADKFTHIKRSLLKRRFCDTFESIKEKDIYLPRIELNKKDAQDLKKKRYYPKDVFIERSVKDTDLVFRTRKFFPDAKFHLIDSLKDFLKAFGKMKVSDYNFRRDKLFLVKEKFDFLKRCPCTKDALGCGYNVLNVGIGCIFDCTYCFLQEYVNTPGIILPANLEDFFKYFKKEYKGNFMRIGTGEFCDSLMLDDLTEYSKKLISFFQNYPNVIFELKTKSNNVDNLIKTPHAGNIVIGFSMNPQSIAKGNEYFAASIPQRLNAIKKCTEAGYLIAIHFDPVFLFDGWETEYKKLIKSIFEVIKPDDIAWISIGSLRFNPNTKKIIEKRFPLNNILDQELSLGYDQKLRYSVKTRKHLYEQIILILKEQYNFLPIYLCMEDVNMWRSLDLSMPKWPRCGS
ncbi:MAG: hypothetical protein PHQ52_06830 [Candidatus Omnitrophica bacterium]|nr:hypothetical protein [Candidatus Omnitrophota bacterium]